MAEVETPVQVAIWSWVKIANSGMTIFWIDALSLTRRRLCIQEYMMDDVAC